MLFAEEILVHSVCRSIRHAFRRPCIADPVTFNPDSAVFDGVFVRCRKQCGVGKYLVHGFLLLAVQPQQFFSVCSEARGEVVSGRWRIPSAEVCAVNQAIMSHDLKQPVVGSFTIDMGIKPELRDIE